jgi:hypothetical protein
MSLVEEDVGDALVAGGYTNIRYYRFDSLTLDQIVIIPGSGTNEIVSGGDVEHPNVQVQVRGPSMADLKATVTKALAIKTLLHKKDNLANSVTCIWNGRYPDFWTDENDLPIFSLDFKVIRAV